MSRSKLLPPLVLAAVLAAALSGACRSAAREGPSGPTWPEMREVELGSMVNVYHCQALWFGGAPAMADLDLAARRGVRTVVSAATPAEAPAYDWVALSRKLGLEPVDLGLESDAGLSSADVDRFLAIASDPARADVLLFCGNGNRSATLFAIYRAVLLEVPLESAIREARRAGMKPGLPEIFVRSEHERLRGSGFLDQGE